VLGIFLGGLAVGYAVFGRASRWLVERARHRNRPLRLLSFYALVEAGIGVYALLFPLLFSAAQYLSLLGPIDHDALGFAFDVALSALLIGPPAVLMGGTIPILTLALAGDLEHATRVHAWIYGTNTLGAFAGALAGGFFLVPLLGLDGVVLTMGVLNLFAAASFFLLERRAARIAPDLTQPANAEPIPRFVAWAAVALLAGFAMMALQTTLNRLGALAFGSSQFTFAMVVAVFVLCIAIGSLAVSALPRIPAGLALGCAWLLVALLFPLYLVLADVTYWAHVIRVLFSVVGPAFYAYQLEIFLVMLAVLGVPIGLSGALLPLLFHELRREVRDLGSVAGRLYAWNTVGSGLTVRGAPRRLCAALLARSAPRLSDRSGGSDRRLRDPGLPRAATRAADRRRTRRTFDPDGAGVPAGVARRSAHCRSFPQARGTARELPGTR